MFVRVYNRQSKPRCCCQVLLGIVILLLIATLAALGFLIYKLDAYVNDPKVQRMYQLASRLEVLDTKQLNHAIEVIGPQVFSCHCALLMFDVCW